jgi:DNA-directed RNA polymerase subunit RPC12/RpoP
VFGVRLPCRQVSLGHGIAEALQSTEFKPVPKYKEEDGPVCSLCERRVSKLFKSKYAICRHCENRIITDYREVTVANVEHYPLQNHAATRKAKTLLFMCARKSGLSHKLADNHFEKLLKAVQLCET